MKAVILAGGLGTRLSEETSVKPKPMVEVGGRPILWHILKMYSAHGINDFIICLGYKGYIIKEYFANYFLYNSDITFDLRFNQMIIHAATAEPWRITLVDTGETSMTGGRLRRVRDYVGTGTFCFTYGDGVGNVNITELVAFHKAQGTEATLTAVQPAGRFGALGLAGGQNLITSFQEKPEGDGFWINGGFFVLSPKCLDLIDGDGSSWEDEPLTRLASVGQMMAFEHHGFCQPMDTLRDKNLLEEYWASGKAPWKIWQ